MRPHTRLVSFDANPGDPWHASSPPIYQTATFAQESAAQFGTYDYARSGNPTRAALERRCAELDGGAGASAFASGLAAITAVTRLLRPGDELLAHEDCYGGSYRLFSTVCAERGMATRYADLVDGGPDDWAAAIGERTRIVFVESITNPLLRVPELRELARAAHERGALLCVDATALGPWWQRPIECGADLVVHSATKLLSGHADVTAGIVVAADVELARRIAFLQNAEGAVLGPFDSWLVLRGMQTLGVRLDRQGASATRVAAWLSARSDLARVRCPWLESHPDHARLETQATGAGTVISFETGDVERSLRLVESLERFSIAVSFGSVASTASLPCRMSHASVPAGARATRALPEDLVRLSIGLEDPEDLIEDLDSALRRSVTPSAPARAPERSSPAAQQASHRTAVRSAASAPHPSRAPAAAATASCARASRALAPPAPSDRAPQAGA
ncbi:MAG: aminotransferase class V-fold PLP-dependent enzyme [Phycisphaerales bacterium]